MPLNPSMSFFYASLRLPFLAHARASFSPSLRFVLTHRTAIDLAISNGCWLCWLPLMIDFRSSTRPRSGTCASRYLIELSEERERHLLVFGQFIFASIRTDVLFYGRLKVCARNNNLREQILLSIIEIFAISCADNKWQNKSILLVEPEQETDRDASNIEHDKKNNEKKKKKKKLMRVYWSFSFRTYIRNLRIVRDVRASRLPSYLIWWCIVRMYMLLSVQCINPVDTWSTRIDRTTSMMS